MTKKNTTNIYDKKSSRVSARMSSELKQDAEAILNKIGLSPSEAINIFFAKILSEGGIPFDLKLPKQTLKAIKDAKSSKNLITSKSSKVLFEDLGI